MSCDIRKVLSGNSSDINLQPQDILYIPGSTGKTIALRSSRPLYKQDRASRSGAYADVSDSIYLQDMKDSFHSSTNLGRAVLNGKVSIRSHRPTAHLDGPRHVDVPLPYVVETDESGKLIDYFRICWRNNWIVALIAFSGFVFALLVSLPQQPMYRAQAAVEIQDANENFLNKGFDSSSSGNSDTAETSFFRHKSGF